MVFESNNKGWVKFHRHLLDHWISHDKPYRRGYAWVYLIAKANHKDKKIGLNGRPILVKRGQHLTSIVKLGEVWGWSRHKVSNFLNNLEKDNMILQRRTTKYTLITIVNYNIDQSQQYKKDIKRTTKKHRGDINKKENNDKNNPLTSLPKKGG